MDYSKGTPSAPHAYAPPPQGYAPQQQGYPPQQQHYGVAPPTAHGAQPYNPQGGSVAYAQPQASTSSSSFKGHSLKVCAVYAAVLFAAAVCTSAVVRADGLAKGDAGSVGYYRFCRGGSCVDITDCSGDICDDIAVARHSANFVVAFAWVGAIAFGAMAALRRVKPELADKGALAAHVVALLVFLSSAVCGVLSITAFNNARENFNSDGGDLENTSKLGVMGVGMVAFVLCSIFESQMTCCGRGRAGRCCAGDDAPPVPAAYAAM